MSCFLFPIVGQLKAKHGFVSPKSGERETKPCINIFKEKFNPLTLKRIEEGNRFILCYFHSINSYLFILYLFQTAYLRRRGGGFNKDGAYSI